VLGALVLWGVALQAQRQTTWSGVYTADQAAAGEAVYLELCSGCHRSDLGGGEFAPALAGAPFTARWDGRALNDLIGLIRRDMPQDRPQSLSRQESVRLTAYLLKANGFPAGANELSERGDAVGEITFTDVQP
jgi:S-disulfanyl-L-cysteine oxidoreductase SoxD